MKKYNLTDFFASILRLNKVSGFEKEIVHILKTGNDEQFTLNFLSLLEALFSLLIIACLCAIAIPSYRNNIEKAKNSKILSEISRLKIDASIYYAEYGKWPPSFIDKSMDYSDYKSVQFTTEGQIVVVKKQPAQQLIITPFISKNDDVLWLCGYAKPPSSYSTTAKRFLTTIPPTQLPRICVE